MPERPLGALALALLLGLVAATGARAGFPSLYVAYNTADCTFKLTDDAGSGFTTITPGIYQVVITTSDPYGLFDQSGRTDLMACKGFVKFRLSGPGVSLYTTLDFGDAASELYTETFQANATYTMQDDTNVPGTRRTFTVGALGATSPTSTTPSKASPTQRVPVELPLRGKLDAVVSSAGKLRLTRKGKSIGALKTGRYTFAVHDQSKRHGFSIQAPKGKAQAVTNGVYVGWRDLVVTLAPGRWSFFTPGGAKGTFLVVA